MSCNLFNLTSEVLIRFIQDVTVEDLTVNSLWNDGNKVRSENVAENIRYNSKLKLVAYPIQDIAINPSFSGLLITLFTVDTFSTITLLS